MSCAPRRRSFSLPALLVLASVAVWLGVVLVLPGGHVEALKAAGVGGKGSAIAGLSHFISAIRGNLTWLAVTLVGVAVIVVGLLFMSGHSRAQDYAVKALAGAAIIAAASGIVA